VRRQITLLVAATTSVVLLAFLLPAAALVSRVAEARALDAAQAQVQFLTPTVGLGERDDEILEAMRDLRHVRVDVVTLGQYLRPTPKHAPVERYVTPEQFKAYEREGYQMGFQFVASGPLVRSSYHAAEAFVAAAASTPAAVTPAVPAQPQPSLNEGARPVVQPPRAESTQLIRAEDLVRR